MSTLQKIGNRLNPVLVLYLRRMVCNSYVLYLLSLYALALTAITSCVLFDKIITSRHFDLKENLGSELTRFILIALAVAGCVSGLYFIIETSRDEESHLDMLFATPLDEMDIGIGKTLASAVLTVLFYAVTMPFLTTAWLLGGVDLRVLFTVLICLFLNVQIINTYLAAALFHRPGFEHRFGTHFGILTALPIMAVFWSSLWGLSISFPYIPSSFEVCFTMLYGYVVAVLAFYLPIVEMYRVNFSRCSAGERFWVNMYSVYAAGFFMVFVGGVVFSLLYTIWKIFH